MKHLTITIVYRSSLKSHNIEMTGEDQAIMLKIAMNYVDVAFDIIDQAFVVSSNGDRLYSFLRS